MQTYNNLSGNSDIIGYEIDTDSVRVYFSGGSVYTYTEASAGIEVLEVIKMHAMSGSGLNGYLTREKPGYETKS